ncbi:MAG: phosphodiester glycosidase family protein [Fimbriimonadaceae bacterium]|nr:phosphodiester glycosidase family protein [Fimbriimonadaceae bacterium]
MWNKASLSLWAFVAASLASAVQLHPVEYQVVRWNNFAFHSVSVDLRSEQVSPAVIHSSRLESIWSLVQEDTPTVAVTGTFFHPTSASPVGDIVVDGKQTAEGYRGSVVAVDWYGDVKIFDSVFEKAIDWSPYRFALRGTVRIIRDGIVAPDPRSQKFRDPRVWSRAERCAVGTTNDGRLIIFATNHAVTLSELGKAMLQVGATNAVNMDGGTSAALLYRGDLKVRPARKLTNLFVVYERSPFLLPSD